MKHPHRIAPDLEILECTLRDGSYAVDFRFTAQDTTILCQLLSKLGFRFIEVGHGFGIGASEYGKGEMTSSDKQFVSIAKKAVKNSKIGMFCIPNIATREGLEEMADAGLDFVRIGNNAVDVEKAFPFIEVALRKNLYTFVNFMKTYAVSPEDFAKKAEEIARRGAHAVYIVDSAGCMYPEDIRRYMDAVRKRTDIKLGFHGHNNLFLAVANTLEFIKNGGNFVDTTIYGIGRGAGNAPTEVILAVLKDWGIDLGVDMLDLMDLGERYLEPLKNQLQMHNMLSVVTGYGRFHSSFLPQVKKVADRYNADLRQLIIEAGRKDPNAVDEKELVEMAKKLKPRKTVKTDYNIISFSSPKIGKDYLSTSVKSVKDLMDGLVTAAAKAQNKIVVEVAASTKPDENFIFSEYVTSDHDMTMGRLHFGSPELLKQALEIMKDHLALLLIDSDKEKGWVNWDEVYETAKTYMNEDYIIRHSSRLLQNSFILENVSLFKAKHHFEDILVCGTREQMRWFLPRLSEEFRYVYIYEQDKEKGVQGQAAFYRMFKNGIVLKSPADWKHLNLNVRFVLYISPYFRNIGTVLKNMGKDSSMIFSNFTVKAQIEDLSREKSIRAVYLDPSFAYKGKFTRWTVNLGIRGKDV